MASSGSALFSLLEMSLTLNLMCHCIFLLLVCHLVESEICNVEYVLSVTEGGSSVLSTLLTLFNTLHGPSFAVLRGIHG